MTMHLLPAERKEGVHVTVYTYKLKPIAELCSLNQIIDNRSSICQKLFLDISVIQNTSAHTLYMLTVIRVRRCCEPTG